MGKSKPCKMLWWGKVFTGDIDVHSDDKDRLDTCCSVPPYCLSIAWSKRSSNRMWVLPCLGFRVVAGVSTPQRAWLSEVFIWCTLAHVTLPLPCWQIYAVSAKFHRSFLQSLGPHSKVLLRAANQGRSLNLQQADKWPENCGSVRWHGLLSPACTAPVSAGEVRAHRSRNCFRDW